MKTQAVKQKKTPAIRAKNIPGSDVGKKRYDLYANAYRQIEKARAAGCYIECIAILESIIADRLEARRAALNPDDITKHRFWTLQTALKLEKEEVSDDQEIKQLYGEISTWSHERDSALHEMVKLGSVERTEEWEVRYRSLKGVVREGMRLARQVSRKVKFLNDEDYKRHAKTGL
jgi:hypothetical protein